MNSQPLYDLGPVWGLLALGALLAALPLIWLQWRHRHSSLPRRRQALVLLVLFLTLDLILVGSFTRLTDSGLGCPDWPGCYGTVSPVGARQHIEAAQTALPSGPVTHKKAWIEMVHRYLATGVGALIVVMTVLAWRDRRKVPGISPWWASFTLLWVCLQGAFGALTVTMKLFPAIVTLHLLGAYALLALLVIQAVLWSRVAPEGNASDRPVRNGTTIDQGHRPAMTLAVWLGLLLVLLQASSGAWVSTNYAVLVCADFPQCQGVWWPPMDMAAAFEIWRPLGLRADGSTLSLPALTAIHVVHRLLALVTASYLVWLAWRLRGQLALRLPLRGMVALLVLQVVTGLSNVVLDWPLLAAMLHTGGAGGLVAVLVWMLAQVRVQAMPNGGATR